MQQFFQKDYIGEYIITKTTVSKGKKSEVREWIEPTFTNENHNNVAHIIGNGSSRSKFKIEKLLEVHGGLLAKEMGQVYACNAIYRDFKPDFLVLTDIGLAEEFADQFPDDQTIAISYTKTLLAFPGKYHLVPMNVKLCAGALATYIACFHGHTKIYLLGFDNQYDGKQNNMYAGTNCYAPIDSNVSDEVYITDLNQVMQTYTDVTFTRVIQNHNYPTPDLWKYNRNFRQITYKEFISECDIGVALNYLKKS